MVFPMLAEEGDDAVGQLAEGHRVVVEPGAAKARRDATHRENAVMRLFAGCWKFKVGCLKFTDGCAVRLIC
jgi:hypothetical protein